MKLTSLLIENNFEGVKDYSTTISEIDGKIKEKVGYWIIDIGYAEVVYYGTTAREPYGRVVDSDDHRIAIEFACVVHMNELVEPPYTLFEDVRSSMENYLNEHEILPKHNLYPIVYRLRYIDLRYKNTFIQFSYHSLLPTELRKKLTDEYHTNYRHFAELFSQVDYPELNLKNLQKENQVLNGFLARYKSIRKGSVNVVLEEFNNKPINVKYDLSDIKTPTLKDDALGNSLSIQCDLDYGKFINQRPHFYHEEGIRNKFSEEHCKIVYQGYINKISFDMTIKEFGDFVYANSSDELKEKFRGWFEKWLTEKESTDLYYLKYSDLVIKGISLIYKNAEFRNNILNRLDSIITELEVVVKHLSFYNYSVHVGFSDVEDVYMSIK